MNKNKKIKDSSKKTALKKLKTSALRRLLRSKNNKRKMKMFQRRRIKSSRILLLQIRTELSTLMVDVTSFSLKKLVLV